MLKRVTLFIPVLLLLFSSVALAHPGRTDSKGGHTCRTNCSKWGLSNGEYHYHGGSSKSSSSASTSSTTTSKTVDNRSEEEKKADSYIWQGDYYIKAENYYNALYYYIKVNETGYTWKVNQGNKDLAAKKTAEQASNSYANDQLAKARQYYTLLGEDSSYKSLYDVPGKLQLITARQAFLDAFGVARWYFKQGDFVNAVLVADKEMGKGLSKNAHAIKFMDEAALKLSQQAYKDFRNADYTKSLRSYNVLANAVYVPADLKESAVKNVKIVQNYIKE